MSLSKPPDRRSGGVWGVRQGGPRTGHGARGFWILDFGFWIGDFRFPHFDFQWTRQSSFSLLCGERVARRGVRAVSPFSSPDMFCNVRGICLRAGGPSQIGTLEFLPFRQSLFPGPAVPSPSTGAMPFRNITLVFCIPVTLGVCYGSAGKSTSRCRRAFVRTARDRW